MRGCLLVRPCGCATLDGVLTTRCPAHAEEGGELRAVPELDAWLRRQEERQAEREVGPLFDDSKGK